MDKGPPLSRRLPRTHQEQQKQCLGKELCQALQRNEVPVTGRASEARCPVSHPKQRPSGFLSDGASGWRARGDASSPGC